MDEGAPISYQVLDSGVPVVASDGAQVGQVAAVIADQGKDVFHGLLLDTEEGLRFAPADAVGSIHEHVVDLRIDSQSARGLPEREHAAPVFTERPDLDTWRHWVRRLTGRGDWDRQS